MQSNNFFIQEIINRARVARLSTIDYEKQIPHIVPVVFAFDGHHYFIPLDNKRKKATVEKLKRVRNIQHCPNAALLIDEYNEDWSKLLFIMIQGKAYLIGEGDEKELSAIFEFDRNSNSAPTVKNGHELLYQKYTQYQKIGIGNYCIILKPQKIIFWKNK
ncbi:MAG: pyridoxamine 5'-phosphate oxidase family protein [Candidatus Nitrosocosmicus sp.]|nr:pyridoxamine 5'-phosphate oxidase family protein [Candidatus Nitrosocosmicus sp.]MDN5868257.1 pyridoxamine 5'-phosphate oxidase family protein [Candidatus Nitrosocosmicus sp.]